VLARPPKLLLALCLLVVLVGLLPNARAARAESALELVHPEAFGAVPASTYDTQRRRVGAAHLVIEKLDNQDVRIFAESGFDGGARQVSTALFEPIAAGRTLRPVLQESRSFHPNGSLRSTMSVDHRAGTGTCGQSTAEGMKLEKIDLPPGDRVANVVLTLLFEPLVKGDEPSQSFQLFLCEGGARLIDFEGHVERRDTGPHGPGSLVEVRYRPDLGPLGSMVADYVVPRLSYWFDPTASTPWLAHRLPLYSKGPEVIVVRDGVPPRWLTDGN
jgi:hypothetical protein